MNCSFAKFVQNGSDYYFAASWKEKLGDVEVNLYHEGSCYNCSVNVKDFESMSSQAKLGFSEFWEQSLSMWANNSLERKDLEVKHDDSFSATFIWKKVIPNNPIKQRMGSIKLKKNVGKGDSFLDCLVDVIGQFQQTIEALNEEKKMLLKSNNDSLRKLQELSSIKEDVEKTLFSKFVQVLNQKKDRIKYLKTKLETREFEPPSTKDNISSRKRKHVANLVTRKKNAFSESDDDYCNTITTSNRSEDERSETDDNELSAGSVSTAEDADIPSNLEEKVTLSTQENRNDICSDIESDSDDQLIIKHEISNSLPRNIENEDLDLEMTQELVEEKNHGTEKTSEAKPVCDVLEYLDDLI